MEEVLKSAIDTRNKLDVQFKCAMILLQYLTHIYNRYYDNLSVLSISAFFFHFIFTLSIVLSFSVFRGVPVFSLNLF